MNSTERRKIKGLMQEQGLDRKTFNYHNMAKFCSWLINFFRSPASAPAHSRLKVTRIPLRNKSGPLPLRRGQRGARGPSLPECYNEPVLSVLLFNSAFGFYVVGLFHSIAAFVSKKDIFYKVATASVGVGFILHSLFLLYSGLEKSHLPLTDLKGSLAFFAWTVSLCFFISYLRYRIEPLGLFLLPLVTVLMLGTVFIKSTPVPEVLRSSWLYLHTICLFLAYGMFFVTFIASLLYLFQEHELKTKKPKTFYYWLPSLLLLDELFYKFLISGFCFMTLGLLAGVIWAEQDWIRGWQSDPKVIATFVTWVIYLVLIYLRLSAGWRGRRAAAMSMAGFLSVLFTFLGARYLGGLHSFQ